MTHVIHPSDVMSFWPVAILALNRAFADAEVGGPETYLDDLVSDRAQLWATGDAWAITRVHPGKSGRVLEIAAIAGENMADWKVDFFDTVEAWAKKNGCVASIATGRMGWIREMPDYKPQRVVLKKEL